MKTLIMLSLLFLLPIAARAQEIPFNYTGLTAEAINAPYTWYTYNTGYTGGHSWWASLGGPGNNDLFGAAEQFTLDQPTKISALNYDIYTRNTITYPFITSDMSFVYNVYADSRINGNGSMTFLNSLGQSDPVTFLADSAQLDQTFTGQVAFDATLPAGTYWLTEQGDNGEAWYSTAQTYIDPPLDAAVAPEPSTIWLLALGLIAAFKSRFLWKNNYS